MSIEIHASVGRSVGPSDGWLVGLSVCVSYEMRNKTCCIIDEEMDKKRPLIDPPCGGY